jgi:anti-anti-sigma regulatory factor
MSFTITISPDGKTVSFSVSGRFDLSLGFALWQYCQPEKRCYQTYIFNLSSVSDLRDSGLAWLKLFTKWAREVGADVHLSNASSEIEKRCIATGIDVATSATYNRKQHK